MVVAWQLVKRHLKRNQSFISLMDGSFHYSFKNLVKGHSSKGVLVAHPTGVEEVVGSIPTWNSEIFSVVPSIVLKQPS